MISAVFTHLVIAPKNDNGRQCQDTNTEYGDTEGMPTLHMDKQYWQVTPTEFQRWNRFCQFTVDMPAVTTRARTHSYRNSGVARIRVSYNPGTEKRYGVTHHSQVKR